MNAIVNALVLQNNIHDLLVAQVFLIKEFFSVFFLLLPYFLSLLQESLFSLFIRFNFGFLFDIFFDLIHLFRFAFKLLSQFRLLNRCFERWQIWEFFFLSILNRLQFFCLNSLWIVSFFRFYGLLFLLMKCIRCYLHLRILIFVQF